MNEVPKSVLAGVALIALGTLLLEVDITRIFAVTLWYYFGFLAISLALLGTAAAGVLCFLRPKQFTGERYREVMAFFSSVFALLTPIVIYIHLHYDLTAVTVMSRRFQIMLATQFLLFFLIFFCAGMVVTIALFRHAANIGKVYFIDLVGAAIGSVAVIILLYRASAPALAFAVSAAGFLAALCFLASTQKRVLKVAVAAMALLSIALLAVNDRFGILAVQTVKTYSPMGVQTFEKGKVFEKWSPVSRVAVFAPTKDWRGETMEVTNDAGAPTSLIRFDGDFSRPNPLLRSAHNVGYHLRPKGETLVIGSAGGSDILAALTFGNRSVTAVEINPVIGELVTKYYADYIGRIFFDPRVKFHVQEGRNYAAGSRDRYDLVKLTMIDSWAGAAAGAYLFNENTLYTWEAIRDYYTHLKPGGIVSITRYERWDEAARILSTCTDYLNSIGLPTTDRIAVTREKRSSTYNRITILMKNGPFTRDEVAQLQSLRDQNILGLIYAPYLAEKELEQTKYGSFMRRLATASADVREEIIARHRRDISPSTDDRPFFFFTDPFSRVLNPDYNVHPARRLALPLLYASFILFLEMGLLTIIVPLFLSSDVSIRQVPKRVPILVYFAGLGVGFMLVEISLIHRLTVFLGQPAYSFVVVLTSLLFASGIGSYVASRWSKEASVSKLTGVLAAIVGLVLILAFFVYDVFIGLMWLELPARIGLSVAVLLPTGFLLGMCFPMGMQIARGMHEHLVPWGWGVNGAFSVFASACSLVIALNFGLKAMMFAGAFCYAVNLVIIHRLRQREAATAPAAEAVAT